tara:strand:+ start:39967 stop:40521 length:555 start_codon:yes stop_codon:yes gene_type:complete
MLTQQLTQLKAYRKDREEFADYVLDNPNNFEQLLDTCFKFEETISYKATWILEMVCLKNLDILFPHLERFLENLPKVYKPQAVRPMAKICEELTLSYYSKEETPIQFVLSKKQREQLIETCFDWLITDQKVAVKAYAMQCLFLLGKEFKWIHPELKIILEKDFHHQQPAFKARARHILKNLQFQ